MKICDAEYVWLRKIKNIVGQLENDTQLPNLTAGKNLI